MNNGNNNLIKKVSIFLGVFVILGGAVAGYTEVKIQAKQNKEDLNELKKETNENIKEIKKDNQKMLIQQTNLKKDISYLISMVESLKTD